MGSDLSSPCTGADAFSCPHLFGVYLPPGPEQLPTSLSVRGALAAALSTPVLPDLFCAEGRSLRSLSSDFHVFSVISSRQSCPRLRPVLPLTDTSAAGALPAAAQCTLPARFRIEMKQDYFRMGHKDELLVPAPCLGHGDVKGQAPASDHALSVQLVQCVLLGCSSSIIHRIPPQSHALSPSRVGIPGQWGGLGSWANHPGPEQAALHMRAPSLFHHCCLRASSPGRVPMAETSAACEGLRTSPTAENLVCFTENALLANS